MTKFALWWRVLSAALRSKSNRQFYDQIAPIYDQFFVKHKLHAENITRTLLKYFPDRQNEGLSLDLGCGTGMLTRMLSNNGVEVVGLDLSLESIRQLQQHNADIPVLNANASRLPLADNCCLSVVSLGVWRHIPDPQIVITEIIRILRNDGILIIGYFPPEIAGTVYQGHGAWGKLMVWLYQAVIQKRGYIDRADLLLEKQTINLLENYFGQISIVDSGKYWHLIIAKDPAQTVAAQ